MCNMRRDRIVRNTITLPRKGTGYWLDGKTWNSLTPNQKESIKLLRQQDSIIELVYYKGKTHPELRELCQKQLPEENPSITETSHNIKSEG